MEHASTIEELGRDECLTRMATQRLGRLGVVVDGVPLVLPMQFVMDGETVVFQTNQGAKVFHAPLASVSFEVDHVDWEKGEGWSVLLQGYRSRHHHRARRALRGAPLAERQFLGTAAGGSMAEDHSPQDHRTARPGVTGLTSISGRVEAAGTTSRTPRAQRAFEVFHQGAVLHEVLVADEALQDVTARILPEPLDLLGSAEERHQRVAEPVEVAGILEQHTRPRATWSTMPPTAEATTALAFHMPSATVRPKPSARLFCTITVAWRCSALTIAAFSSTSSMGRLTSRIRRRCSERQGAPRLDALARGRRVLRGRH